MTRLRLPRSLPALLSILVAFLCLAGSARAGVGIWTPLGPDGAQVTALAVDPLDPKNVYAGTVASGLFRSTDGGTTWVFSGFGLGNGRVSAIAADPLHAGTVYAANDSGGLFKSTDGGVSWVRAWDGRTLPVFPGAAASIFVLAPDPRRPGHLYAGSDFGFLHSADGGSTWSRNDFLEGRVNALAVDPSGGWIFAGFVSYSGHHGLYKSSDLGRTWVPASQGLPPNEMILSLAIDPERPRVLLAGTTQGVFRTNDRGGLWKPVAGTPAFHATAVAFQRGGRAYAAFRSTGVFRSTDAGLSWQPSLVLRQYPLFFALAAGPDAVYTGNVNDPSRRGLMRSLDGGATWQPSMRGLSGLEAGPVAIDPSNPRTLYVGAGALFKSTDRGATWARLHAGFPALPANIFDVLIDPARPSRVYVTAERVPLLRSHDAGVTWERLSGGSVPGYLSDLAIDPRSPGALWGIGTSDQHGLFHSPDGGTTWNRVAGLSTDYFGLNRLEVDPRDPAVLSIGGFQYVGPIGSTVTEPRLFRSVDAGATWVRRDAGLAGGAVQDIALDTADPSTLYAVTDGVYRSTDAGATWSLLSTRGRSFASIATAPAGAGTLPALYAARADSFFPTAVLRSTDQGESWQALRPGLDSYTPRVLEVDPTDPRRLYLTTAQRGLMTYTLDGQQP